MRKKDKKEIHSNNERWLLTYSDMITLLLALFILMYTISSLDTNKYAALSHQLGIFFNTGNSAIGVFQGGSGTGTGFNEAVNQTARPTPAASPSESASPSHFPLYVANVVLQEELQGLIDSAGLGDYASVDIESRGVVVGLVEGLMFDSGSAKISDEANQILLKIIDVVNSVDNYIRVEGYTDNRPIHSAQFDSNWELAAQRSINVAKFFISYGVDPSRISATSYSEYRPVVPNDSEAHRQLNRRVDIVFISSDLNIYEAGSDGN
jgi:Flagellar motor protein